MNISHFAMMLCEGWDEEGWRNEERKEERNKEKKRKGNWKKMKVKKTVVLLEVLRGKIQVQKSIDERQEFLLLTACCKAV